MSLKLNIIYQKKKTKHRKYSYSYMCPNLNDKLTEGIIFLRLLRAQLKHSVL